MFGLRPSLIRLRRASPSVGVHLDELPGELFANRLNPPLLASEFYLWTQAVVAFNSDPHYGLWFVVYVPVSVRIEAMQTAYAHYRDIFGEHGFQQYADRLGRALASGDGADRVHDEEDEDEDMYGDGDAPDAPDAPDEADEASAITEAVNTTLAHVHRAAVDYPPYRLLREAIVASGVPSAYGFEVGRQVLNENDDPEGYDIHRYQLQIRPDWAEYWPRQPTTPEAVRLLARRIVDRWLGALAPRYAHSMMSGRQTSDLRSMAQRSLELLPLTQAQLDEHEHFLNRSHVELFGRYEIRSALRRVSTGLRDAVPRPTPDPDRRRPPPTPAEPSAGEIDRRAFEQSLLEMLE